jgi:hypothetical protein
MMIERFLPYVWYPLFVGGAAIAFGAMLDAGVSIAGAAYLPIIFVGLVIVLLEWWFPERLDWRPRWHDIRSDAVFMALVQVVLPRLLTALGVIALAMWLHEHARSPWWPHDWPLAAQAVLMVLAVPSLHPALAFT